MEYSIVYIASQGVWRLTIFHTGEIREATTIDTLLKSLVGDFGYYLRRK